MKLMRTCIALALASVCGAVPMAAMAQAPADFVLQSVPDGPVAKVNGVNISRDEYTSLYREELATAARAAKAVTDEVRLRVGLRTLVLLIQRELLYQEAVRRNLQVSDAEVEERWASGLEMLKKNFSEGGDVSESDILKETGATKAEALKELRKAMLVDKMRGALLEEKNVTVSDKEIADFFEKSKDAFRRPDQYHVKQVFMNAKTDDAKKAVRSRIEKALKRVRSGESFEGVAREVSESPDRDKGGDMGLMPAAGLPPFYIQAANALEPGQISGILESPWGLHFIQLVETIPGADASLDQAKPMVKRMLMADKSKNIVQDFCAPFLEKPGYIEVYLQLEKTLAMRSDLHHLLREPGSEESQ